MGLFGPDKRVRTETYVPGREMHGTSFMHWQSQVDQSAFFDLRDYRGVNAMLLGLNKPGDTKGLSWIPEIQQGHALTFGTTRCGKGTNQIIPALLSYLGSMIVLDPKGENAWITAERRRKLGHKVIILDPWNNVNIKYANHFGLTETVGKFNPLKTLDPSSRTFGDDVYSIADALVIPNEKDSHWTDSAREFVAGLIAAVVMRAPGVANFKDVRRLIAGPDDKLQATIQVIVRTYPGSYAASKLARFASDNREIQSIKSTANTQTSIMDTVDLMDSMETDHNAFDLAELATGRATLYLVLPPDKLLTHGRWLRLILTLAIKAISRQPVSPKPPVVFLLDEFGTITPGTGGGLKMIEQSVGLMAGLGMRIWAFMQNLGQLQNDYPSSWETFIANSSVITLLSVGDKTTSTYFSEKMGTMTITEARGNVVPRPVMFAQEIESIRPNHGVIMMSGGQYYRLYQTPYYLEPRWKGLYRPPPAFAELKSGESASPVRDESLEKAAKAAFKMAEAGANRFKSWVDAKAKESREARATATAAKPRADLSERQKWADRIKNAK